MNIICEKEKCTGCGLCASICPKQSIRMKAEGALGNIYPQIDSTTCIDCGLCKNKCPSLYLSEKHKPFTAYAAWSKDEDVYKTSTSGGAASVLSQNIINQGGVVYGCAMLTNIEVQHIRVDKIGDVNKLKGSKYVQSDITNIIPLIKEDIKYGRLTLFIGTPCQVAAIKSLFKTQPTNLILVDLVCHGVPSVNLLRRHVKKVANYSHYDTVYFREGSGIYVVVVVDGQIVYRQALNKPRYKDWYINTFFDGYTYRESCYQCPYACPERISDITIGDFWGLGKKFLADEIPPHPYGCSLILPVTDKGKGIIENMAENIYLYERNVEEAIMGNNQLRSPMKLNFRGKMFRKLYPFIGTHAYKVSILDKYLKYNLKRVFCKIS